jgi:arylsulfatase A-like enzyme
MSFYTGRYASSHGSTWNNIPLKVGEMTLGDHLRPLGVRTALCGKTHMTADVEGMRRLGLSPDSEIGVLVSECGFEPFEREDGLHPDGPRYPRNTAYDTHMKERGWPDENPWQSVANSDEDSETPYITGRAMDFIRESGDTPWCLHLSYIKPHWPYIVLPPYHEMYGPETHRDPVRSEAEKADPHPADRRRSQP